MKKCLLARAACVLSLTLFFANYSFSQQIPVSGKVVNDKNEPLAGATITIKGSNTSVATKQDGTFQINAPSANSVLVATYVGFEDLEVTVGTQRQFFLSMISSESSLDNVIVIGYGMQKKGNITGAVSTFNAEKLDERPVNRVDQALVGQVAGVRVKQTSGVPGAGFSVQIRGTGSISANNEPLYVIDGFPLEVSPQNSGGGFSTGNPLDNLNPNDIESIEVLKDASAAAIYGSRGSNGVVLITTKKGRSGKMVININSFIGFNERERKLDVLDAEGWIDRATEMINDAWVRSGSGRTASQTTAERTAILGGFNAGLMLDERWAMPGHPGLTYVDWQDEFFRKGLVQDYQLSASGGNSFVKYYISGDYLNQEGITWGLSNKRYSSRANVEVQASNKIKFGINIAPTYSIINEPLVDGKDQQMHIAASLAPVVEADAGLLTGVFPNPKYTWAGTRVSPVEVSKRVTSETKLFRTITTAFGEYTIIPGLSLRTSLNLDNADSKYKRYIPREVASVSSNPVPGGALSGYKRLTFVNENTLSYTKTFAQKHNVSVVAGQSYATFKFENWSISPGAFTTNDITTINAATAGSSGTSSETKNVLISYFGRVQYDYEGRYLLSASLRTDGSSKFGDNTKWGTFPSVSAGWRVSSEKFMQSVSKISELKIRGSWGITGNNGYTGDYNQYGLLSFANYSYGGTLAPGQAINSSNFPNPDLSWEESETIDIGLDLGLFKNRIFTSFDWYQKRNSKLLLSIPVPLASGFTSALTNIGKVLNKGWEWEITSRNIVKRDLKWTTTVNLSHNTNKVEQLGPNNTPILFNGGFDIEHSILMVGQPMYSLYLVQEIGVLTTQDIANGYPEYNNEEAGDPKYLDANKDGKIDPDDRILSGHPNPDYTWGISNTVSYKGFDLSFLFQGQWGGLIYSMLGRAMDRTGQGYSDNALASYTNRWRSPADDGKPGINYKVFNATYGRIKNTDWLYPSDYWRLRTLTLGYNLGTVIKNKVISGARIYVTLENMLGKDKYKGGWNPEAVNTSGEDYGGFPLSKGVVVGLNLTF
jgi:TonB-dependent starch-binding outer membrane protein SusC